MGQDHSSGQPHDGPPEILESRDLQGVAKYIKSDKCKRICVMLGAGVSTSAGIPDFRSPDTGLYANLARLDLPYPEAVFEINFFRNNPEPFYTLARELLPGRFRPTPTHSFVKLLADHGLLGMCFTQNIDTLERMAGVPPRKIIEAHGSFANQHCVDCGAEFDKDTLIRNIRSGTIAHCKECDGLVKPDIVFFGEALPTEFHKSLPLLHVADLLIVMGTSLTVHPFAALAGIVPDSCPRVLINLDQVGDFGTRSDDVICLGKTDDVVRDLCKELEWDEELESAWKETENSVVEFKTPADSDVPAKEPSVEDEIQAITEAVDKSLHIGAEATAKDNPNDDKQEASKPTDEGSSASIRVEVNHTGSTKPKATYIIGGVGDQDSKKEEEDKAFHATPSEHTKDEKADSEATKLAEQKL